MSPGLLSGCNLSSCMSTHLALSFVLGLLSLCSFRSVVSAPPKHAPWRLILYSSIVCGVLQAESLQEHKDAITTTPEASLREHDPSTNVGGRDSREIHVHTNFSQCNYHYSINMNVFKVQHTNTYIHTLLGFNMLTWGSLRLTPISITIVQTYTGKYHEFVAVCIVMSAQHK